MSTASSRRACVSAASATRCRRPRVSSLACPQSPHPRTQGTAESALTDGALSTARANAPWPAPHDSLAAPAPPTRARWPSRRTACPSSAPPRCSAECASCCGGGSGQGGPCLPPLPQPAPPPPPPRSVRYPPLWSAPPRERAAPPGSRCRPLWRGPAGGWGTARCCRQPARIQASPRPPSLHGARTRSSLGCSHASCRARAALCSSISSFSARFWARHWLGRRREKPSQAKGKGAVRGCCAGAHRSCRLSLWISCCAARRSLLAESCSSLRRS